ncbi:MAG: carbohydrate ABC transporter permease [Tenericutes bacterium]|jgi:raffinose/stachyose/melibiose transport system permease protein|nr:carbohydrate ABC transporter permease [Mycoplasmatota bacterium]
MKAMKTIKEKSNSFVNSIKEFNYKRFIKKFHPRNFTRLTALEIFAFVLLIIFLIPFYLVLINSSKTVTALTANPLSWPTSWVYLFDNISYILGNDTLGYGRAFISSIIITTSSLILIGIGSAMAAWVLVRNKTKLSFILFMIIISGLVIPFQVVMLPLVRLLSSITEFTGIPMRDTYYATILAYMGFGAPLSIFLFHGFIKSIPMDIEEAAMIDGCSKPQVFFRIVLPILKPIFVTLLILNGMWIWNDYLLPLLIIGSNGDTQTIPLAISSFQGTYSVAWDLMLTSVLLAALPVIVLFLFAQKYIIKGMTSGAIK